MGGLPCAKVIIDRGGQNKASIDCVMSLADLFQLQLGDKATEQAVSYLVEADALTKKALHVLEKSLGLPSTGYGENPKT